MTDRPQSLRILWACSGKPSSLASASAIRRWLLPVSSQVDVLSVAPVERALTRRMTRWTAPQREQDLQEAEQAASLGVTALGDTDVPIRSLTRWGTASRQIAMQAEESHPDLVVLGAGGTESLAKMVLGQTAQQTLFETTRSVLLARPVPDDETASVIVLYSSQRLFANAVTMLKTLRLARGVPIYLVALLEPVKPFGSMFLTFNEEIRVKEQAAHDVQTEVLRDHLADVAAGLSKGDQAGVRTVVRDTEPRETPAVLEEFRPGLVIVGDSAYNDPLGDQRRTLAQIVSRAACSVLVAR